jgi:hypothetical protein
LAPVPDAAVLEQARKKIGLSIDQLWISYFGLGGRADPFEFAAIMNGIIVTDPYQYNVTVQALNECFTDQGRGHPIAYLDVDDADPKEQI